MSTTGFTVGGKSLRTPGWEITSVEGWDSYPSWRGDSVTVANRHGVWVSNRRFANSRSITIPMVVLPYDPITGAQTLDPLVHLQNNVDELLGSFYGAHSELAIVRTMPDGSTRSINGEVVQAIDVGGGPGYRELSLQLDCAYPFWKGDTLTSDEGNSGTFSVQNDGNAPVGDAVFVFTGAAQLYHTNTGDIMGVDTASVDTTIDVGERTIVQSGSDVDKYFVLGSTGYWIELAPGNNGFILTGTGTVSVYFYDGWL